PSIKISSNLSPRFADNYPPPSHNQKGTPKSAAPARTPIPTPEQPSAKNRSRPSQGMTLAPLFRGFCVELQWFENSKETPLHNLLRISILPEKHPPRGVGAQMY